MDPKAMQAMEAPLIALANSSGGDMRKLLYAFFSFLHRRTDFYLVPNEEDLKEGKAKMGFPEGEAEKFLLAAFRQFPLRRIPRQDTAAAAAAQGKATTLPAPKPSPVLATTENKETKEKEADPKKATTTTEKPSEPESATKKKDDNNDSHSETVRYTEEGLQVPIGNGGSTPQYKWTQTIEECTVMLGIPDGLRAKELDVSIKASSIHVKTKKKDDKGEAETTFVEGTLVEKVQPDECTWSMEGGVMIIILCKLKKTFWNTVIVGDEKIDASLVDSRRHISSYDEATQGQLRKIMFDQKQQEKGLPTSDELTGVKTIPKMPPGVEYIDKTTIEKDDEKKKAAAKK